MYPRDMLNIEFYGSVPRVTADQSGKRISDWIGRLSCSRLTSYTGLFDRRENMTDHGTIGCRFAGQLHREKRADHSQSSLPIAAVAPGYTRATGC